MKIVIDMQGVQTESRFRGIGGYSKSLVRALLLQESGHEIVLLLNGLFAESIDGILEDFHGLVVPQQIRVWYPCGGVSGKTNDHRWRRDASALIRESCLHNLKADLVFITSYFEGYLDNAVTSIQLGVSKTPTFVCLYDLIPLVDPKNYLKNSSYKKFYFKQLSEFIKADGFLSISDYSSAEANRLLGIDRKKICTIGAAIPSHLTALPNSQKRLKDELFKFALKKPFILAVGGGDPRKNIKRLISAFLKLPPNLLNTYDLVLAGPGIDAKVLKKRLAKNRADKIHVLGHVSDEAMIDLYGSCSLFVFPSLSEGFGLPPLEAMHFGAPVISSNVSCLPEIVGDSNRLFDPKDINQIKKKMVQVLCDENLSKALIESGKDQALKFNWNDIAKRSLRMFETFFSNHLNGQKTQLLNYSINDVIENIVKMKIGSKRLSSADLVDCSRAIAKTFPKSYSKEKIAYIDISELVQRDARTGVQRVTRSILLSLLESPPMGYKVCPIYADIHSIGYRYANKFVSNLNSKNESAEDAFIEPQPGDIFLGLDLQHHTTRVQANYLRELMRNGVSVYFVVYDLLPIQFPEYWPKEHSVDLVHQDWLRVVCDSHGAICISKSVKKELEDWIDENKIRCKRRFNTKSFYLGCDIKNKTSTFGLDALERESLQAINNSKNFLMVGTIEPRKAHLEVIRAFEKIWVDPKATINLIIVGKEGWLSECAVKAIQNSKEYGKRLYWFSQASDEFLDELYKVSSCLICASKGEGFGLPLIEAAQYGIPIIARDIPVFREVAKEGAYFYKNDETLHLDIISWLALYQSDMAPTSGEIKTISWDQSAKELWSAVIELEVANLPSIA